MKLVLTWIWALLIFNNILWLTFESDKFFPDFFGIILPMTWCCLALENEDIHRNGSDGWRVFRLRWLKKYYRYNMHIFIKFKPPKINFLQKMQRAIHKWRQLIFTIFWTPPFPYLTDLLLVIYCYMWLLSDSLLPLLSGRCLWMSPKSPNQGKFELLSYWYYR